MAFDPIAAVLYQDALVFILNKPAGLAVHVGPGKGDHLGNYLDLLRLGSAQRPELAHRLDRDTSGCLALGRTPEALRRLGKLFAQSGQVQKTYWAIVAGVPPQREGVIDQPLLRVVRTGSFGFRMLPDPAGQPAITDYKILGQHNGQSWLELRPRTGRTHQLRVHCACLGCPVVGDDKYGLATTGAPLMLHARNLILPLYPGKPSITATAPPPEILARWLALLSDTSASI